MWKWLRGLLRSRSARHILVQRVGDEATAERLIAYEIQRAPGIARDEAIRRALERLEYERSR